MVRKAKICGKCVIYAQGFRTSNSWRSSTYPATGNLQKSGFNSRPYIRETWGGRLPGQATNCSSLDVPMVKSRNIGDGHPTFLIGILIMGPYKPLRTWVEFPIPYYMEIMGVDRPWQLKSSGHSPSFSQLLSILRRL